MWLVILAPPVLYVLYSVHFAVNVPYWDDWLAIPLLRQWHDGFLNIGMLYGGDNGQRAFFARVLGLGLAVASGFNTKVTIFAGDGLLVVAYGLLLSVLRRAGAAPLAIAPVGLLFFSLSAYDVALWASNFSWSLETLCLIGTLWCLQRLALTEWYFAGAFAFAIVGAFSSFQGLLIWPAGLVYLVLARYTRWRTLLWIGVSLVAALAYFAHLSLNYGDPFQKTQPVPTAFAAHHATRVLRTLCILLGNVFSGTNIAHGLPIKLLIPLGVIVLVLCVLALARAVFVRSDSEWFAAPAALILFGLLAALAIAASRSWIGDEAGLTPRYTLYTLLVLCGLYLMGIRLRSRARWIAAALIVLLLPLQISATTILGLRSGAQWHHAYLEDAMATQHFGSAPMSLLGSVVYWYPYQLKTILAPEADALHLSVFHYRLDLHPPCLSLEPAITAQPNLSANAEKALHAAYAMAHEPFGPPRFGSASFDRQVLRWATSATQDDTLGQCLLSYSDEYQTAYAALSARLATRQERNAAMLPLPGPAGRHVRESSQMRRAWILLSFLYRVRGEAAYEFPEQVPGYQQKYLAWAARAPVDEAWNPAWNVLGPYAPAYSQLAAALSNPAQSGQSRETVMAPPLDAKWDLPIDARFFHARGGSYLGVWGSNTSVSDYARSGRIPVHSGAAYEVAGTIDARYVSGSPPCFYLAEPSGYGIAMTCGDDGEKAHYSQVIRVPKNVPWVYWVAYTNKATIATDHLLLYADASMRQVPAAQATRESFGPTPQISWYVPQGFQFVQRAGRHTLAVYGTGTPLGNAYAHSGDAGVVPGGKYRLSVIIDARYVRGNAPCVYIAEQPSGQGVGMLCARNGGERRYSEIVTMPANVRAVQTVAFTNNATVAFARRLSFSELHLARLK